MAAPWKWAQPFFSFGCKAFISNPVIKVSPKRPLQSSTKYLTRNPKISANPSSISHPIFGEINPDMLYLCRQRQSVLKRAVFAFFPSVRRESIKKTLNLRFFAKKQVNFWAVYLLKCKTLIINENIMVHREIRIRTTKNATKRQDQARCNGHPRRRKRQQNIHWWHRPRLGAGHHRPLHVPRELQESR